jgi:hypothetical protein
MRASNTRAQCLIRAWRLGLTRALTRFGVIGIGVALLAALVAGVTTPQPSGVTPALADDASSYVESFAGDTLGADPTTFAPLVGFWSIATDGDNRVLLEDGNRWDQSSAATSVVEQARALYGDRYAELLDNVENYSYFPAAVAKHVPDFQNGEITVRVKPIDGRIDQAGGIIFNIKENGDYLILRCNAVENNLVLFRYEQGVRTVIKWIRNVPTETGIWHDLKLDVHGTTVHGYLDGKLLLEQALDETVSGRVGVWSKADSVVYFDDFTVQPSAN